MGLTAVDTTAAQGTQLTSPKCLSMQPFGATFITVDVSAGPVAGHAYGVNVDCMGWPNKLNTVKS
jgi:hypothetical protein